MRVLGRRALKTILACVIVVIVALGVLCTPVGGRAVLSLATAFMERSGVRLSSDRLDLNLLTLTVELADFSLARSDQPELPFVTAERLRVVLPWSVATGQIAFSLIHVDGATVSLVQSDDGVWNLPPSDDQPSDESAPDAFELPRFGELRVRDLAVDVRGSGYGLESAGIDLELDGMARARPDTLTGRLGLGQPMRIAMGERTTTVDRLDARFSLDGESLVLESVLAELPEGRMVVNGDADSLFDEPALRLSYQVDLALNRAADWWRPDHRVDGHAVISGEMTGTASKPTVTALLDTQDLRWGEVSPVRIEAQTRLTGAAFFIDTATVGLGEGRLDVSGRVGFADGPTASQLDIDWQRLDTAALMTQLGLGLSLAPAGLVSGTGRATWTEADPRTMGLTMEIGSEAASGAPGRLPFGGVIRMSVQDGGWRAEFDALGLPGIAVNGEVSGVMPEGDQPLTDTTLGGGVVIDVVDLARALEVFDVAALVSDAESPGARGTASVRTTLAGTVGAPRVDGRLTNATLGYRGLDGIDLRTTFSADPSHLVLRDLNASIGSNTLAGAVRLDFDADGLDGQVDLAFPDLSALAPVLPATLAPTGGVEASLLLSGSLSEPVGALEVEGQGISLAGRTIDQIVANLRIDGGVIAIDQVDLHQRDGVAQLRGSYSLADGVHDLTFIGEQLSLAALMAAVPEESSLHGAIRFDVRSTGSLDHPTGSGTLGIDDLDWAGRALGDTDLAFAMREGLIALELAVPALAATAVAELGLGADPSFDVAADFIRTDLGLLLAPETGDTGAPGDPGDVPPWDARGVTTLRVRAKGARDALADTAITADLEELELVLGLTRVHLVDPGSIRYAEQALTTERVELRVNETSLTLAGSLTDSPSSRVVATLNGDLADFEALVNLGAGEDEHSSPLALGGAVTSEIVVTGSFREPTVSSQIQLRDGLVSLADYPPLRGVQLDLGFDSEAIRLDRLSATWQDATVNARGAVPTTLLAEQLPAFLVRPSTDLGGADLSMTVEGITSAVLAPFVDASTLADLQTQASVRLEVRSDDLNAESLRGRLVFDELDFTLAGIPVTQNSPTEASFEDGQLTVGSWVWSGLGNELSVGGRIDVRPDDPAVDLTLTGNGDLRVLGAFADGLATTGQGLAIVNLQGTLDQPTARGVIEITDAELRVADPPLLVSDLSGSIWLEGRQIRTHELAGQANGGDLTVDAAFELEGLRPLGSVTVTGRQLALEVPTGLRTEIDADVTLDATPDQPTLEGTVTVVRGDYRETLNLTTGLLAALEQQQQVTVIGEAEPSVLDTLLLNLRVVTEEDVVVDNNYANGVVGLDLRVVGTAGAPGLTGRLSLREGAELRFGNNVYEVESGEIDFIDPTGIVPELNITAQTRISSYQVTLGVNGPPEELTTSLQSDPELGESDIVSLLLTGRTLDQVGAAPGAIARDQALGLMSGELQTAGRAVGLDTVRVESEVGGSAFTTDSTLVAGDTNPGSRLTFGKNLSDDVQLIVSQNLRETGLLTWIVDYLPRRNFEVRGVNDDVNDRSYEFRHSVTFGEPPTRLRAATSRVARPAPTVAAVTFGGEPGFAESELLDSVRLRPNDRFVFRRWLQDRARLERFYHDRGYLEARLRARRGGDTTGQVSLEYEIERGPFSVLTIEGYDLSGRTRARMRDAWSTAVFDAFLLGGLEDLARRELVEEAHLNASVEAEVLSGPGVDRKEIRLRVEPGPRYSERLLAFSGNQQLSASELDAYLDARALRSAAWTDADPVVSALTTLYRGLGFLDVEVVVGSPVFEADRATLPIAILENAFYRIATVGFQGAENFDDLTLRAAANLQTGSRYTAATVQQARSRVSVRYRQSGFTRSRVSIQSTIDRAKASVDVVVQVDEGPRQVIAEVEVAGAGRTRPELVTRALQIDVGQPVDLAAWNQARRRLYETGAFRSVDVEAQPVDSGAAVASGDAQPVRARVLLREWPAFRVRYGLQLKDERVPLEEQGRAYSLGAVADVTHQNFLGRAATVGSAVRYDADQQALRGFMTFRRFFGLPVTSNIFASRLREEFSQFEFVDDARRLTLEQRVKPTQDFTLAYSYNLSRSITESIPADPQFTEPAFWIARLNTSAVIDTRNDIFNATSGSFHSSTLEYSPAILRSDLTFAKYSMQQYYYRDVGSGVVLASAGRLGLASGLGGQALITAERFFAGGGNTVRGYAQDSLGPSLGGDSLVVLNQEVRFPLVSMLRGVGFIDAGNTFDGIKDLSLQGLEIGVGFGLRAATPFGLFRFDVGFPVSTDERGNPRLYFSVGQAF